MLSPPLLKFLYTLLLTDLIRVNLQNDCCVKAHYYTKQYFFVNL